MPEARLVVALSGRHEDEWLIGYANQLAGVNRHAAQLALANRRARSPNSATESAAVAVDETDQLMVSAPQRVDFVDVSSNRPLDDLLALAATDGVGALLVGEGHGRRCLRSLIQRAACSVWFVPDGAPATLRRLLVPLDFSLQAADSLRVATTLARLGNAEVCQALHVYFNDSPFDDAAQDCSLRAGLVAEYARFLDKVDVLGVDVRLLLRACSLVADAIDATATEQGSDLIVLGTRGRTWAGALLRESLAEQTVRRCRVPLLVLKHFGAQVGLLRLLRESDRGTSLRWN